MKRSLKTAFLAATIAIASVFGVLLTPGMTFAKTVSDVKDKYIARGFWSCYHNFMQDNIKPLELRSYDQLIKPGGLEDVVGLPPGYFDDTELTCKELFEKFGFNGNFVSATNSVDAVGNAEKLKTLGYKEEKSGAGTKCVTYDFGIATAAQLGSPALNKDPDASVKICAELSSSETISKISTSIHGYRASNGQEVALGVNESGKAIILVGTNVRDVIDLGVPVIGAKWDTMVSGLTQKLKSSYGYTSDGSNTGIPGSLGVALYFYRQGAVDSDDSGTGSVYKLVSVKGAGDSSDSNASYKVAYKNLTNKSWPGYSVSKEEQAALYQDFLVSYYKIRTEDCADKKSDLKSDRLTEAPADQADGWHKAKLYKSDGKAQYCFVSASDNTDEKVYGITTPHGTAKTGSPMMVPEQVGFMDILNWLNNSSPDKISAELAGGVGQSTSDDSKASDEDEGDGTKTCYDGAGALGWVLCAVLDGVSSAVDAIYTNFIEPALTINADLLTVGNNEENGAYATWQIFQTFANIIFVIMILVVIFSQLTGVGIDNYGIKRILPRLIIAAILINLSFIICQLLVDLSNILGVSLKNLFDGLGQDVGGTGQVTTASGHVVSTFVVIITGAAAAGAFLSLGLGVIIPILIAALSALIAIFFLFLVLAGRQAAVVILVVMSPLALVMYMLPNTKQYFDKFIKIFVTLLIVFPICGLVMGGGDFVSRMLLRAGGVTAKVNADGTGFFYQISAILVSIVPFFFIPSLVKNSLAGLGNIGAKISSIGSGVKGKATGASRGALDKSRLGAAAKDRQAYRDQVLQRRRAGINRKGEVTKFGQFRRNVADGKRLKLFTTQAGRDRMKMAMGNAQSEILKSDAALTGAERMLDGSHVEAVRAGMGAADFGQAVKDQAALIDEMTDGNGNRIVDSPEALGNVYSNALSSLNANPDSSEAKAKVYALQNRLASTDAGRAQLQSRLEAAVDSGQTAGLNAAASHLVNDHAGDIKNVNRGLFNWASQAAGGNISSMASHYADGTDKYTAQTIAAADEAALQHLASSFGSMDSGQQSDIANTAYEALNSDNINLKPEVRKQLEEIVDNAKKAGVTPRITAGQTEAQAQTQALNDINDTLREIHANQSAPTPPPQPKDNGPSTEDWDNYINGNL